MHLVDKIAYKCICCYHYHHHCYWNYYHKHYHCYHNDNHIFLSVTMWRETLIPWFGNVKWFMCVLVLSMWSVGSNISFQVYLLSFSLSSQTKKLNKKWNLQLWEWICFNSVVLFIIWIKIPLHISIYSVTDIPASMCHLLLP